MMREQSESVALELLGRDRVRAKNEYWTPREGTWDNLRGKVKYRFHDAVMAGVIWAFKEEDGE